MNTVWRTMAAGLLVWNMGCTIETDEDAGGGGPFPDGHGWTGYAGSISFGGEPGAAGSASYGQNGGHAGSDGQAAGGTANGGSTGGPAGSGGAEPPGSGGAGPAGSGGVSSGGAPGTACHAELDACLEALSACYNDLPADSCSALGARCRTIAHSCQGGPLQCQELLVPLAEPVDIETAAGIADEVCAQLTGLVTRVELLERGVGLVCCPATAF